MWYNDIMNIRKDPLVNGEYYHIFSRSIAKYVVFNDNEDYTRFLELLTLYRFVDFNYKYSTFKNLQLINQRAVIDSLIKRSDVLVEIVAQSPMPTHIHLVLKQIADDGISKYMAKVLNSYTKYFNARHRRIGPLWEGHFKNVLVKTDEQLLHLTRYAHLNASSAGLVDNPFDWEYSSLKEYCEEVPNGICQFKDIIDMSPQKYKKFVLDQKSYQRSLSIIKNILIDNYTG